MDPQPQNNTEIDLDSDEHNLRQLLFELQRKRNSLDDCRKELNESILREQELQRQLDNEKFKNSNDEIQNVIVRHATETLEEERQKTTKELVKLKVQNDLTVAERDSLRKQVRSQCIEITTLKRKIDDLSSKHKCHMLYQKDMTEQLNKLKISINEINDSKTSLREGQNKLKQISENNNALQEMLHLNKNLKNYISKIMQEKLDIEKQLIIKTAELSKFEDLFAKHSSNLEHFKNENTLNYWKNFANDLVSQLKSEKESVNQLNETVKLSHENEENLKNKLSLQEQKIIDLEMQLSNYQIDKINVGIQTNNNEFIVDTFIKLEDDTE